MLLMIEKGISGGICHATHRYVEADNKYIKNYDKNKESSYIMYLGAKNLYGWKMSQKLLVNDFKWKTDMSIFDKEFTRNHDDDSDIGYILEATVDDPKDLHDLHSYVPFLPERIKLINAINLYAIYMIKKTILLM